MVTTMKSPGTGASTAQLPNHPKYRRDIDGLRAIAVLSVVAFHAAPGRMPGGFIGVDVFFVISGFLISSIILKGLENNRFSFIEFYARRVKRIFPALMVVLLTVLAVGYFVLLDEELRELSKHVLGGAGFVSNLVLWSESGYFDESADMKPLLHLWSLGIEEQYYLVWPLLLWFACKRKFGYLALTLGLALLSFVLNIHVVGTTVAAAFYSPLTRFWELMVGSGLACVTPRSNQLADVGQKDNIVSILGASLLVAGFLTIDRHRLFPGWWAALPTIGTALVIWAGPRVWLNRTVLSNRVLVWFGLISFPLYLWHWPALSFLRILEGTEISQWKRFVAVVVAILLAWLTYEFLEKPIRRQRNWIVPAALFAMMGSTALAGTYGYLANGFAGRAGTPQMVNSGDIGHFPFFSYIDRLYFPCTPIEIRQEAGDWNGFVRCFQSKKSAVTDVVLLGDSHAEHLFPGLAIRLPQSNVVFYGKAGLPFLANKDFNQIFDTVLGDARITTVLISANWAEKLQASDESWKMQLSQTVTALTAAGKAVYLIDDVPRFSFIPSRCKYAGRLGITNKCSEPDRRTNLAYMPALKSFASAGQNVGTIEIYQAFCDNETCTMAEGGVLHFRDDNHLNVDGSIFAADAIVAHLRKDESENHSASR